MPKYIIIDPKLGALCSIIHGVPVFSTQAMPEMTIPSFSKKHVRLIERNLLNNHKNMNIVLVNHKLNDIPAKWLVDNNIMKVEQFHPDFVKIYL